MSIPPIQYSGPRISEELDPEVRRHLQLIYQKLGNHTQAFQLLSEKAAQVASSTSVVSTVNVQSGGTGSQNFPLNAVLIGNGASPILAVSPVESGFILTDSGPGNMPFFGPLTAKSYLYSQLSGMPTVGQIVVITDAMVNTWGTAVSAGGGPYTVLAWCDSGASWSVIGI